MTATDLRVRWIRSAPELERLGPRWRALEERVGRERGFNLWAWRRVVYDHQAREGSVPLVGAAWRGEELLAVAPLLLWRGTLARLPVRRVDFAGHASSEGDFLSLLDPGRTAALFVDSLLGEVRCDAVGLFTGEPGAPAHEAIAEVAGRRGWRFEWSPCRCAAVTLPCGVDGYLRGLGSKYRRNIRKRAELAEAEGGSGVECAGANATDADLHRVADRVFAIANRSWKVERLGRMDERYADLYRRIIVELGREGRIRCYFLQVGGRDAAYFLALLDGDVLYDIAIGFDDAFRRFSPGVRLTQEVIRSLPGSGIRQLVSHGDHDYKEPWATEWRAGSHVLLYSPRVRGRLAHFLKARVAPAMERLRGKRVPAAEQERPAAGGEQPDAP